MGCGPFAELDRDGAPALKPDSSIVPPVVLPVHRPRELFTSLLAHRC